MRAVRLVSACLAALVLATTHASAKLVSLQEATATFSQTQFPGFPVSEAIDGDFGGLNGWAVARSPDVVNAFAETAAFETATDIGSASGAVFTFSLYQLHLNPGHNLGKFRLSVTSDPRSDFADGLASDGDVTANWAVLQPLTASATGGSALIIQGDGSILACGCGSNPDISIYTVTAFSSLAGITGIRLEALEDPSLPHDGPGRRPENGNFVLTEFVVSAQAVPEPGSRFLLAAGLGFIGMLIATQSRRGGLLCSEALRSGRTCR